jgi:flagellar biosynthesis protein FlhG
MDQQEITLGEMMDNCKDHKAKVLTVTSGKGGVGKTNIAANLAICLAASGKKVVLIDADLGLGNLDIIMNITSRYNLWHVACGQKSLTDVINSAQAGVEVICGGSGLEEMANLSRFQRQRLLEEMDQLQHRCDIIIIDTSAGINNSVLGFCAAADHVLITTTPEPSAMTDAYAMIKVLAGQDFNGRISLTVNQAESAAEGKRIYRQLADVANRFLDIDVYDAGFVYRDDKVPASVKSRQPVVLSAPRSKATACIVAMAARISKGTVVNSKRKEGFFRKVVNWFF